MGHRTCNEGNRTGRIRRGSGAGFEDGGVLAAIDPSAGAVVMGTGIVSIGLLLDSQRTLSRVLLAIAALLWVALGALWARRVAESADRARRDRSSPASLAGVAASAVLGTRLVMLGWTWAGIALMFIALGLWAVMLGPVLRSWRTPTVGASLLLTVSTESLAVLSAAIAAREHVGWLAVAALAPLALGLGFYAFSMARFDLRELAVGRGDHWITGGALAISTLGAAQIAEALERLGGNPGLAEVLETVAVVLWALTLAWLPALLIAEALRPRVRYHFERWATVFPVGMYAACSFVAAAAVRAPAIGDFARVWVWLSLAVWLAVSAGLLASSLRLLWRGDSSASPST
jgi:tellurite resistance protein TehA-like permease